MKKSTKVLFISILIIVVLIIFMKLMGFKLTFNDYGKEKAWGIQNIAHTTTCSYFGLYNEKLNIALPLYTIECSDI